MENLESLKALREAKETQVIREEAKRKILDEVMAVETQWLYKNLRVWSWLRTNAGGAPNTCKSNGVRGACTINLVADGWVTREQPAFQRGITFGNER